MNMKIIENQLRKIIREEISNLSSTRRKPITSVGLPVHLYLHKNEDGTLFFHIESSTMLLNKDIPHGGNFDGYGEMGEKEVLQWIKANMVKMIRELNQ